MGASSEQRRFPAATDVSGPAAWIVVDTLADGRWLTRLELTRQTGLSPRTVDRVVHRLVGEGLLEQGPPSTRSGRPASPVRLKRLERFIGTVALHRDEIAAAVVTQDGSLHGLIRDTTRGWQDITDVAELCRDMLSRAKAMAGIETRLDGIVVGFPLPYQQGVGHVPLQRTRSYSQEWVTGNLAAELTRELGLEVVVENNCRLAALAEYRFGAAVGCEDAMYLQLVGGSNTGIIAGGQLLRGTAGFAGEISHLHVVADGPPCPCGARGCLGVCIQNSDRLIATWREVLPAADDVYEVLNLAVQGDVRLRQLLYELGLFMGEHLAAGCIMLNPSRLVIDGSLGLAVAPVVAGVTQALQARLPDRIFDALTIRPGAFGSEAALIGAAAISV